MLNPIKNTSLKENGSSEQSFISRQAAQTLNIAPSKKDSIYIKHRNHRQREQ